MLHRIFGDRRVGFYVDIGAHHPLRFSNTHFFYARGWSGINVDAMPGSMAAFKQMRPRDVNLEIGIANDEDIKDFYMFHESALNGVSKTLALERHSRSNVSDIESTIKVKTHRLADVLASHLPAGQKIDFMNIDVEGFDLEVLHSNDWNTYRPAIVLVEILHSTFENLMHEEIVCFMRDVGYEVYAKSVHTVIFRDAHALESKE
jgi:FkbM family methyltransferase